MRIVQNQHTKNQKVAQNQHKYVLFGVTKVNFLHKITMKIKKPML